MAVARPCREERGFLICSGNHAEPPVEDERDLQEHGQSDAERSLIEPGQDRMPIAPWDFIPVALWVVGVTRLTQTHAETATPSGRRRRPSGETHFPNSRKEPRGTHRLRGKRPSRRRLGRVVPAPGSARLCPLRAMPTRDARNIPESARVRPLSRIKCRI